MRRIIVIVIALMVVCLPAVSEEYVFRKIPWDTDIPTVLASLGFETDDLTAYKNNYGSQLPLYSRDVIDEMGYTVIEGAKEFYSGGGTTFVSTEGALSDFVVAEHPVTYISMSFVYGNEGEMVTTDPLKAHFVKACYYFDGEKYPEIFEDLWAKLVWLYGDPTEEHGNSEDENFAAHFNGSTTDKYFLWKGDNDTAILLSGYWKYEDKAYKAIHGRFPIILEYGKRDIAQSMLRNEKLLMREEMNRRFNADNTDGL